MVVQGVKFIAENLIDRGYQVKFTYVVSRYPSTFRAGTLIPISPKGGSTDATVDLTLPLGTSCDQAEKDMLAAIDTNLDTSDRARIKSRSGYLMVSSGQNFTYWVTINPASFDWYQSQRVCNGDHLSTLTCALTISLVSVFSGDSHSLCPAHYKVSGTCKCRSVHRVEYKGSIPFEGSFSCKLEWFVVRI